jgi:hypothetical protein
MDEANVERLDTNDIENRSREESGTFRDIKIRDSRTQGNKRFSLNNDSKNIIPAY